MNKIIWTLVQAVGLLAVMVGVALVLPFPVWLMVDGSIFLALGILMEIAVRKPEEVNSNGAR